MRRYPVDMRALFGSLFCLSCLSLVIACGSTEKAGSSGNVAPKPDYTRVGSTSGGPIVVSRDERVAVATNRTAGVVTVFHLDPAKGATGLVTGKTQLDIDDAKLDRPGGGVRGSEPWAAVLGKDDDSAYVIARQDSRVLRITDLRGDPKIDGWVDVGSEPTSIVISPKGVRLFVANWGEGTISVINTPDPKLGSTFEVSKDENGQPAKIDLNETLAQTGFLGNVEPRQGLAHPRALAMTDNGDERDVDETLYATDFFSQPIPLPPVMAPAPPPDGGAPPPPDTSIYDKNRQGVVYRFPLAEGKVSPITLAPVESTGFNDSDELPTGCFPNQLYAAAVNADRLYVTSMCASPKGPLGVIKKGDPANPINDTSNFKTVMHPVLFAIDIANDEEVPRERRVLTKEIEDLNATSGDTVPRMPLIPNDLVFARTDPEAKREAFIAAAGADAVFRLGDPGAIGFLDIAPKDRAGGHLPIGTAVLEKAGLALVLNDQSQSVSVVDLTSNKVAGLVKSIEKNDHADTILRSEANQGRFLFVTGTDEWSFKGQAWGSCEGCHPDGLSDGVTWFFSRGPRRTISTAGTYDDAGTRRVMLWTGNIDEVHDVEVIVRTVTGGVGAVMWTYPSAAPVNGDRILYDGTAIPAAPPFPGKPTSTLRNGLNGSVKVLLDGQGTICTAASTVCDRSPTREWNQIDAYVRSVRAPNRPTSLRHAQGDERNVAIGEQLFRQGRCAACHGGPSWTISRVFYEPGDEANGALPYKAPPPNADGSDPVFELGRLRKETYTVPPELQALNPVSLPSGVATFRTWKPDALTPLVYLYGPTATDTYDSKKTHGNDQINCVLRDVGTFPTPTNPVDNVVPGAPPVLEVRADMKAAALGDKGFNIPSLLGLATAGSYFHAGNARTLEEAFEPTFDAHLRALQPNFLSDAATRKTDVANLVAYLLSIDDTRAPHSLPSDLGFDPDLCAQMKVAPSAAAPSATPCFPGARRCAGTSSVQSCDPAGNWVPVSDCNSGETCTSCSGAPACAPFPAPVRMDDVDLDGYVDEDIQLSMDELSAFFISDRPGPSGPLGRTVWVAARADRSSRFSAARPMPVAHSGIFSIGIERDFNTLYFEGTGPSGINGLFKATGGPGIGFDAGTPLFSDAGGPWINQDTTRLYYDTGGAIAFANRVGESFVSDNILVRDGFAPVLSWDELTLYYATHSISDDVNVYVSRRSSLTDGFGGPSALLGVNASDNDVPDWISDDGCRLYLHRYPLGGTSDIYVSEKK